MISLSVPPSIRQLVVLSAVPPPEPGMMSPIGSRRDLVAALAGHNTAPERRDGDDVLYGPGFRIELAPRQDPVTQMLLTITEEEIGWKVIPEVARKLRWKLLDPNTGMELAFQDCASPG